MLLGVVCIIFVLHEVSGISSDGIWEKIGCNEVYQPPNCDFNTITRLTVEDYERCGPARLNVSSRNYFLGASGRRITYNENKAAYRRIRIVPKLLRDVSDSSLDVSTLGQRMKIPIGLSPVAFQRLANPMGEVATIRGISDAGTVMVLSSFATTTIEQAALTAAAGNSHLWMQTYLFKNRTFTQFIVRRAERAGFKAIVVTIDSPIYGELSCAERGEREEAFELTNLPGQTPTGILDDSLTFRDITWLRRITRLPIVAKGILSVSDAISAVRAGASAIFVSNHGGRQLDSDPATIDVLPEIVRAVNRLPANIDVYVDGGIRNGWDVYKAIASGAKMAFVGRPIVFGLAKQGEDGVRDVINILRNEFQEAMLLSGASNPSKISRDTLRPSSTRCDYGYF